MATPRSVRFSHSEPRAARPRLIPVFLPFAGCPGRCVFCDQHAQTGASGGEPERALRELRERLAATVGPFELGFFGGTFTGMTPALQGRFLEAAARFRGPGGLGHVRVSTRPDRVDRQVLARLRDGGVDMVELGVQTFHSAVLERSGRGYDGDLAAAACDMVREAGLELGIQLLPGLPGHGPLQWGEDVRLTVSLTPDVARIYPCVVMAGTGLAEMHARGEYEPWSLETAVEECGRALPRFWEAGVRVIRLGLAGEPDMLARLVVGPWHPAFGNMARSRALRAILEERLRGAGRVSRIFLPARLGGELWGHGRANAPALELLGITKETAVFWQESEIVAELEE